MTRILTAACAAALIAPALAAPAFGQGGAAPSSDASNARLVVELEGVEARPGTLYVGVQTESQFMQNDGVASRMLEEPEAGEHVFEFALPAGRYAVSAWHDDDADGAFSLDESFRPLDGWSMSGGAGGVAAEPRFEDAAVTVSEGEQRTRLRMTYPRAERD